jgi:hypothetical protein
MLYSPYTLEIQPSTTVQLYWDKMQRQIQGLCNLVLQLQYGIRIPLY